MDILSLMCCLISMFFWGAAPVIYRFCGDTLSPQKMQAMRSLVFFSMASLAELAFPGGRLWPGLLPFVVFSVLTMVDLGLGDNLYFMCVSRIGAGKASALCNTYPLYVVLFSWLLLGEGLSPLQLLGAFSVVLGLALLCLFKEEGTSEEYGHRPIKSGLLLGIMAGLCWCTGQLVIRWVILLAGLEASEIMFWRSLSLFVFSWVLYLRERISGRDKTPLFKTYLTARGSLMIVSGLFILFLPGWLAAFALERIPASVQAPITGAAPMVAALLGHWLFKERLTQIQWIGIVFIISGGVMVNLL